MTKNNKVLTTIVGIAFMSALVFVGSMISIPIPTVLDVSRIHLGNIFCLLAGFMLGGAKGGFAAGLGSMLYDFTNPKYIASSPITFINKFMMGFVCGCIAGGVIRSYASSEGRAKLARLIIAAAAGALTYVALYVGKGLIEDIFFLRAEVETALLSAKVKTVTSLVNAVIAVVASVPLAVALKSGLRRAGLTRWLGGKAE